MYVVKGWKLHSPHNETACSLDQAVDIAWWARSQNEWAPRIVDDHNGKVILDEAALDTALRTFDPWR